MDKKWHQQSDAKLSQTFSKFAGKTIDLSLGLAGQGVYAQIMEEMRYEAARMYSYVRLVSPGTKRDENSEEITRINVEVEPAGRGKWRIGKRFFRG